MTLQVLKKLIQDKYLHRSKITECVCGGFKGGWAECDICGHDMDKHYLNTGHCTDTVGGYTLSSGVKSNLYFDIKGLMCDSNGYAYLYSTLNEFLDNNWQLRESFNCYGGLELGGIPIALMRLFGKSCCFIRKQQRIHGLKKMIEGAPRSPILLVDDVISSSDTISHAAILCREEGYEVAGALCVINRTTNNLEKLWITGEYPKHPDAMEIPIYSLFKESDFD